MMYWVQFAGNGFAFVCDNPPVQQYRKDTKKLPDEEINHEAVHKAGEEGDARCLRLEASDNRERDDNHDRRKCSADQVPLSAVWGNNRLDWQLGLIQIQGCTPAPVVVRKNGLIDG